MTTTSTATAARAATAGRLLNKVPEVTIWFWIIKILCTTVGESFADWINLTLGVGLTNTAWIFTGVLAVVLAVQVSLRRYSPFPYWLTVVVVSITGTLYTDILTDQLNVPLWISSAVFAVLLAAVFWIWWARERTLSIHAIDTRPREGFYWLTVLVTFALGTATGDWTLELTGWSPGVAVLLPLGLILAITALWRGGANPVLSFWLAYILTRPLGANIGDFLGSPAQPANPGDPVGLGLGTFATSMIFLGLILATVIYLAVSRRDVVETYDATHASRVITSPGRERAGLIGFIALGIVTVAILTVAALLPHQTAAAQDDGASTGPVAQLTPQQVTAHLPKDAVAKYVTLAQTAVQQDKGGDTTGSHATVQKMRDAWDADQSTLQAADSTVWTFLDHEMDAVLQAYAIDHPGVKAAAPAAQEAELAVLLKDLGA